MALDLKRLRAERIAKGYTQEEMAAKMGWKDRGTYAKRETGFVDIGVDEFIKIIGILGYKPNEISIFFTDKVDKKEQ